MPKLLDRILGRPTETPFARGVFSRVPGRRSIVASAATLTPAEGKALAKASKRREWQKASFGYARALPEVGYAMRFLANNSAHIRLFVGDRRPGASEVAELNESYGILDPETGARDPEALPDDLILAAQDALDRLTGYSPSGGGAAILSPLVRNYETVGECYLVGRYFPDGNSGAGAETWAVHSISEVHFEDGKLPGSPAYLPNGEPYPRGYFRLVTGEGRDAEAVNLDPTTTTVIRMWTADAEWSAEPDSPMRSLIGVCERLLLIEKGDDAVFRSRAAGNGVLLWPEELDAIPDDDDEEEDETAADLNRQLTTPLTLDGSAAQVVPWLYRGPAAYLEKVRHLMFQRPLDPLVNEREARLLTRLGIGLDVPPEVITGLSDVNHWNAWQISSDTFRHHQEPITIAGVESVTVGYMRARLTAAERWPEELIRRVVVWFDPSDLVAPADMSGAANDAHDRGLITDAAYRQLRGIDESLAPAEAMETSDAPVGDTGMLVERLSSVIETFGAAVRAGFDPRSAAQALGLGMIEHTGRLPVTVQAVEEEPAEEQPALPAGEGEEPPEGAQASAAILAAASPTAEQRRLSRRLTAIEQRLRERIAAAADAALLRALERAGNRARAAAQRDETAREAVVGQPPEAVLASLGRTLVAALGLEEQQLLAEAFGRLRGQYIEWTEAAAEEALDAAARLAGVDRSDPAVARQLAELRDGFHDSIEESWPTLESGLHDLAAERLYEPTPTDDPVGELPDALVPPGLVRSALAVAGGVLADATGRPPLNGLTSGQLLDGFLRSAGQEVVEYEWAYGISSRPFPPHARLDGVVFAGFDDDALSTTGTGHEWVGGTFAPGDHGGCHCDYVPIYTDGRDTRAELEAIGRTAYREQNPGRALPARQATVDPRVYREDTGRPEQRRTPTAETARTARTAPPPPPVEPAPRRRLSTRGRRAQPAVDEAGVPMRLDHAYLSSLTTEQLDDLAVHLAGRLDDANPVEGQRFDDLDAFLTYRDEDERLAEELSQRFADDDEWQAAYGALEERLGRPGVTHPRVGGRGDETGAPSRRSVQEDYALFQEQQYVLAEGDTRGSMLNRQGEARGIDPRELLSGDIRLVYRYASPELLEWFETNRRITWSEFYFAKTGNPKYAAQAERAAAANARINRDRTERRGDR